MQTVFASQSPANRILLLMGEWLAVRRRNGQLSDILFHSLNNRLNDMSAVLAGCERIANTPVPFCLYLDPSSYCVPVLYHVAICIGGRSALRHRLFQCLFPILLFRSTRLQKSLKIRLVLENNDLPLDAICNAIEIDLLQMNDETNVPAKHMPDKHYQLTLATFVLPPRGLHIGKRMKLRCKVFIVRIVKSTG